MIEHFQLDNGIHVVCEEIPESQKVGVQIRIGYGSAHESIDENGLTFLMQESANGGTATRTRKQISEETESRGASLSTETKRTCTEFSISCLDRYIDDLFAVLADVTLNPKFDAVEIEKTKARIEQWIDAKNQNPDARAGSQLFEAVFSGQAAGAETMGSKDLVASFTPEQVAEKHKALLSSPEDICISFAGDIKVEKAKELAERYFKDLKPAQEVKHTLNLEFVGQDMRDEQDNEQLNLLFAMKAPPVSDDKRYAAMLLKQLLSGGMSSPLFTEVRDKRGLVYSVHSSYYPVGDAALFFIGAGTGKGNAGELLDTVFMIFDDFIKKGFEQDDIDRAVESLKRGLDAMDEGIYGKAVSNASQILRHGRTVSTPEIYQKLKNVTSEDIQQVLAEMLQSGEYAFSGVGPHDTMLSEDDIRVNMEAIGSGFKASQNKALAKTQDKAQADEIKPFTSEFGKAPQITELPNGLKVMTSERPGTLSCGAWVGAGAIHETPELNGATHMNEHMMFKGTPSYPAGTIDKTIESEMGGHLNAYTSKDQTAYYFYNLLPEHLEKVIDICGEMVFQANIDEEEFDGKTITNPDGTKVKMKGERDVVIEEIGMYNDDVGSRAMYLVSEATYPDQPQGRPILGTEASLRAMTSQMLRDYRDQFYVPNNVVFSAAGPIKHADFVKCIEDKFSALPQVDFPAYEEPVYKGGTVFREMKDAKLCNFVLTTPSVPATHEASAAYTMLAMILGTGESSRLSQKIVDELGLTADIGGYNMQYRQCGDFHIAADVKAENVKPVLETIYAELNRACADITDEELQKVKIMAEVGTINKYEKNQSACDSMGRKYMKTGKLQSLEETLAEINAVTVDDVKDALKSILEFAPTVTAIVPEGTDHSLLPSNEEVLVMRDRHRFQGGRLGASQSAQPNKPAGPS